MSFWVWVEIVCVDCASIVAGRHVYGNSIPRRDMSVEARSLRWECIEIDGKKDWLCRGCASTRRVKAELREARKDKPNARYKLVETKHGSDWEEF